jgi:uncharacterized repeat protein (TIGR03803 family)
MHVCCNTARTGFRVLLSLALITAAADVASAATYTESILLNFQGPPNGSSPSSSLVLDSAGNLFGATEYGGAINQGVVFKLDANGTLTLPHNFSGGTDGAFPLAAVIRDSNGNLYGTTIDGGTAFFGTVYKISPNGTETVLHNFGGPGDGANPECALIRDSKGNLYGTTEGGGLLNSGTVFKLDSANNETILYSFQNGDDGGFPIAGVVRDSAGNLYGTAETGGSANLGVVFKLDPSGKETVLHAFTGGSDGAYPVGGVVLDADGNLYGTTSEGGSANFGTVYKIDASGEAILHSFTGFPDGANPQSGVAIDSAGNLYGTAPFGGANNSGMVYKIPKGGSESVFFSFEFGPTGALPSGGVILDSAGNLYGTAAQGGLNGSDYGVIYRLDTAGSETVLYSFPPNPQGTSPGGGVVASGADFYGVAGGGTTNLGVLYKLDAAGNETVLHTFTGGTDGANPVGLTSSGGTTLGVTNAGGSAGGGVLFAVSAGGGLKTLFNFGGLSGSSPNLPAQSGGKIYGTTYYGGDVGFGVLYVLDSVGNLTVLHSFTGGADGGYPSGGVVVDKAGNTYGIASCGGTGVTVFCPSGGAGLVFKFDPAGNETILYNFSGGADGAVPSGALAVDAQGNLYGAAGFGGATTVLPFGSGVVFEVSSAGESTLHTFTGADGGNPYYGVTRDSAGNLYGVTEWAFGNVFELSPSGQLTILHTFTEQPDGGFPDGGVILNAAGDVYGTTSSGGTGDFGTVFKITP